MRPFHTLLAFFLLSPCLAFAQPIAPYDLLITNGKVVDGTGASWFYGDIAVRGDTIVAAGNLAGATAHRLIDAKGLVVAPGFIDIHSHSRGAIFQVPSAENVMRQGVTTIIEGNDGSSPIPLKPYFEKLAALKLGINYGSFAGQGTIRQEVMGLVNRPATPEELARMRSLMTQAMRDGAFGLSTGLFYVPGNFTPTIEVIEIAKIAGQYGGMHISHMRDETSSSVVSSK